MARLYTTGFETGDMSDFVSAGQGSIVTSPVRTSTYALRENGNDGSSAMRAFAPAGVNGIYVAFAFQTTGYSNTILDIYDTLGTTILGRLSISANGFLVAYRGSSSVVATATSGQLNLSGWYNIEFYYYCDDAAGKWTVKVNGVTVIDFTGDTKSGTPTLACYLQLHSSYNAGVNHYYDDIVINDSSGASNNSWPGCVRLEPIRPSGAGDNTGLTPSTGSNYACVDEVPASATDYVYDTVVDDYDLYAMGTISLPSGSAVKNVIAIAKAVLDSGSGSIALMTKNGSTTTTGATQALTTTATLYQETWNVNPDDSAAFEQADIDAIQIGVKVK